MTKDEYPEGILIIIEIYRNDSPGTKDERRKTKIELK